MTCDSQRNPDGSGLSGVQVAGIHDGSGATDDGSYNGGGSSGAVVAVFVIATTRGSCVNMCCSGSYVYVCASGSEGS